MFSGRIIYYVDNITTVDNITRLIGWSYHLDHGVKPIRLIDPTYVENPIILPRVDVMLAHEKPDIMQCGWIFQYQNNTYPEIQMLINDEWLTFYKISNKIQPKLSKIPPSYLVVDNFYSDPDSVRSFALEKTFNYHPDYHKGKRTDERYLFDGLKEQFEKLVGRKITKWFEHGVNGVFQYCIESDKLVYHTDFQNYAGIIFLTPDSPPDSGTSLFRSKITKKMKVTESEHNTVFDNGNGYLNSELFETVDTIGNVYNRLLLFDSHNIHAASNYFGTDKNNGRLFQLFFFDIEKN